MVRFFAIAALCLAVAGPVLADGLDDGAAAAYRGDYGTAFKIWKPLAEQGIAEAQNNLGALYARGLGTKKDLVQADKWYLAAAEQGLPNAQANIGFQYEMGLGVDMDYQKALLWYRRAADQGSSTGQFSLGLFYASGMSVEKDFVTAFMWLALASAQGDTEARVALSRLTMLMTPDQVTEAQKRQIDYQRTHPKK